MSVIEELKEWLKKIDVLMPLFSDEILAQIKELEARECQHTFNAVCEYDCVGKACIGHPQKAVCCKCGHQPGAEG